MKRELPEPWLSIYNERKEAIRMRLDDFTRIPPQDYFYELLFCILTPQSSAKNADAVIGKLKKDKFFEMGFDPVSYLRDPHNYIRFHNVKSKRLLHIREIYSHLHQSLLHDRKDVHKLRRHV